MRLQNIDLVVSWGQSIHFLYQYFSIHTYIYLEFNFNITFLQCVQNPEIILLVLFGDITETFCLAILIFSSTCIELYNETYFYPLKGALLKPHPQPMINIQHKFFFKFVVVHIQYEGNYRHSGFNVFDEEALKNTLTQPEQES